MELFVYPKTVLLWFGLVANIPSGFRLCDGIQGTPDLRNRFVLGAGDTYAPGDVGGVLTHSHTLTTNGHSHGLSYDPVFFHDSFYNDGPVSTETDTATTDAATNLPLYKSLCWIMKL